MSGKFEGVTNHHCVQSEIYRQGSFVVFSVILYRTFRIAPIPQIPREQRPLSLVPYNENHQSDHQIRVIRGVFQEQNL